MNLVDNMLHDLEARGIDPQHRCDAVLHGLRPSPTAQPVSKPSRWIAPVVAVVALTGLLWRMDGLDVSSSFVTQPAPPFDDPPAARRDTSASADVLTGLQHKGLLPRLTADGKDAAPRQDSGNMAELDNAVAFSATSLDVAAADQSPELKPSMQKTVRPFSPKEKAIQHLRQASMMLRQGDLAGAETVARQALEADPGYVNARITLAALLINQARLDDAARILETGRQHEPKNIEYAKLYARILIDQGQVDQAGKILEDATQGARADPEFYGLVAVIRLHQGDLSSAAAHYRQALALQPGQSAWWVGLGSVLERTNQYQAAKKAYARALRSKGLDEETAAYIRAKVADLQARQS